MTAQKGRSHFFLYQNVVTSQFAAISPGMLNSRPIEVRSTLEGHPAGGRAEYHHLGVFWGQNPVLDLIALSGRSFSRQNILAISQRQLKYATGWPVSCIIQVVAWGVAFLGPGHTPGSHQASHQAAICSHQAGSRISMTKYESHPEIVCLPLRVGYEAEQP